MELRASKQVSNSAGVAEHRVVRLPDLREASDISASRFPGLPPTYIPMRNSIFYSIAAGFAEETEADTLVGGHNKDDRDVFQDVAPAFFSKLQLALRAGSKTLSDRGLRISTPVGSKTKPQVIRLASTLGVPLGSTWSCHRDGESHCWECAGCLSRARGFKEAGVPDPLMSP
jgi:7-cyano-7-deazaguanine synthase